MESTSHQGFVLALAVTLASPVVKGLIHIPLNQVQLLLSEEVLRFSDVNRGNRKEYRVRGIFFCGIFI